MHHADGQLDGLAAVHRLVGDDLLADDHRLADFLDVDGQCVVEQVAVLHDHLQGVTQRVLMADQQADLAKSDNWRSSAMRRPKASQPLSRADSSSTLMAAATGMR